MKLKVVDWQMNTPEEHTARPKNDGRNERHESQQQASGRNGQRANDRTSESEADDESPGQRGNNAPDEVDGEDIGKCRCREVERGASEIQVDIGECAHERKQDAETHRASSKQARSDQVVP